MRKSYALLKQCLSALTFLFITIILIYSCKKDRGPSISEYNIELINASRTYFQDSVLNQTQLSDNNIRHSIGKIPLWDKAFVKKISIGDAVVVPIKFEYNIVLKHQNEEQGKAINKTSYLMIFKDHNKIRHAEWVTLIPISGEYKGKFVGIVEVEKWNGEFKRGLAIAENGNQRSIHLSESTIYRKINTSMFFNCITIDHYGSVGVDGYEEKKYLGSETFCFGGGGGSGWKEDAPDLGDGGGGPAGGDYTSVYDCNGDLNGSAVIDNICGCIGGNTGKTKCSSDIKNKTTDPCISKVVEDALKSNKDVLGVMADIIQKFDSSKSILVNIYDGHIYYKDQYGNNDLTRPKPGQTTNQQFIGNSFSADITLGIDYLSNTSKENAVATLIHEVIHAYLKYNGDNTLSTTNQHNIISEKYIAPMASYLSNAFNIPLKDAYALAWSGISDSKVYNNSTPNSEEYSMSDGNKITAGEIALISGAYKLSTSDPSNAGFTKGNKICN